VRDQIDVHNRRMTVDVMNWPEVPRKGAGGLTRFITSSKRSTKKT
jgi:hypothetical protein